MKKMLLAMLLVLALATGATAMSPVFYVDYNVSTVLKIEESREVKEDIYIIGRKNIRMSGVVGVQIIPAMSYDGDPSVFIDAYFSFYRPSDGRTIRLVATNWWDGGAYDYLPFNTVVTSNPTKVSVEKFHSVLSCELYDEDTGAYIGMGTLNVVGTLNERTNRIGAKATYIGGSFFNEIATFTVPLQLLPAYIE